MFVKVENSIDLPQEDYVLVYVCQFHLFMFLIYECISCIGGGSSERFDWSNNS